MANKIIIPSAGQITDDFKILNINVKIGQKVQEGDILAEIETDKSTMELDSSCDGEGSKILVKKGDILKNMQNYLYAIDYYQQALDLDPYLFKEINDKYTNLVISIINDVNSTDNFDELKLVVEYLKIIIELKPQYYDFYYPFIIEIEEKFYFYNKAINKLQLKDYIKNKKLKEKNIVSKTIRLGMTIHEVEAILGAPTSITIENNYELWFYHDYGLNETYFFNNYILMKIN